MPARTGNLVLYADDIFIPTETEVVLHFKTQRKIFIGSIKASVIAQKLIHAGKL